MIGGPDLRLAELGCGVFRRHRITCRGVVRLTSCWKLAGDGARDYKLRSHSTSSTWTYTTQPSRMSATGEVVGRWLFVELGSVKWVFFAVLLKTTGGDANTRTGSDG